MRSGSSHLAVAMGILCIVLFAACSTPNGPTPVAAAPPELARAFTRLDSALSPEQRDQLARIPTDSLPLYFMPFGMGVLNEFVIDGPAELRASLDSIGAGDSEDMLLVLLITYQEHLRGEPVDVAAAVRAIPPPPTGFVVLPTPRAN